MTDHPIRDELRAVVPTLEPDEVFLAQLSARAAAGAAGTGPIRAGGGWRVALAPVAVAAVLVGVAWVTGLRPDGLTDPSPAPAPTDATTHTSTPDPAPAPVTSTPGSVPTGAGAPGPTAGTGHHPGAGGTSGGPDESAPGGADHGQVSPPANGNGPANGPGPNAHANGHAHSHPNGQANGHAHGQANGHANGNPKNNHPNSHANSHATGHPEHPPQPAHGPDEHAGGHPAPQAGEGRHSR